MIPATIGGTRRISRMIPNQQNGVKGSVYAVHGCSPVHVCSAPLSWLQTRQRLAVAKGPWRRSPAPGTMATRRPKHAKLEGQSSIEAHCPLAALGTWYGSRTQSRPPLPCSCPVDLHWSRPCSTSQSPAGILEAGDIMKPSDNSASRLRTLLCGNRCVQTP